MRSRLLSCCLLAALIAAAAADQGKGNDDGARPRGSVCVTNVQLTCKLNWERRQLKNGEIRCIPCRKGFYTANAGKCCQACANGIVQVKEIGKSATCISCPGIGAVPSRDSAGNMICVCKAGYQANGTEANGAITGCKPCAAGTANPEKTTSTSACAPCNGNTVAPTTGMSRCFECKRNSIAVDDTSCACPKDYYLKAPRGRGPSSPEPKRMLRKLLSKGGDDSTDDSTDDSRGRSPNPGRGSDDRPGNSPNPGRGSDDNTGSGVSPNPGRGVDDAPGRSDDDKPGASPHPGKGVDDNPGRSDDDRPGASPNPGKGVDDNPGRGDDDKPGASPNPGKGSDDDKPGASPNPGKGVDDDKPGASPNPGKGSDDNPGKGKGDDDSWKGFLRLTCEPCGSGSWANPIGNTWGACCPTGQTWSVTSRTCV